MRLEVYPAILLVVQTSSFFQINPGIAIKTSLPLPKLFDSGYDHRFSEYVPVEYEKTTPEPIFYGDTVKPYQPIKTVALKTAEASYAPYKVEILPEPAPHPPSYTKDVHDILHQPDHHTPSYSTNSLDDPFEPFAEAEADFQPSTFPFSYRKSDSGPVNPEASKGRWANSVYQTEPSEKPETSLPSSKGKLEIVGGLQYRSPGSWEPALTFTSPPGNISSALHVRNVEPTKYFHKTIEEVPVPIREPSFDSSKSDNYPGSSSSSLQYPGSSSSSLQYPGSSSSSLQYPGSSSSSLQYPSSSSSNLRYPGSGLLYSQYPWTQNLISLPQTLQTQLGSVDEYKPVLEHEPAAEPEAEEYSFQPSFLQHHAIREDAVVQDVLGNQNDLLNLADMVDAYQTYHQQWTSTNKKTLVKDASKALKQYHSRSKASVKPKASVKYDVKAPDFYTDEYGRPERVPYGSDGHPIPDDLSLMLLGPEGPELPLLGTMVNGFQEMLSRAVRNTQHMLDTTDVRKSGQHMMQSVGYTAEELMYKMTSHYGDGQLDMFDWLPLLAVIFGGIFIFSSLFPNAITGRSARKDEDILESAISQLENGVLMLSAIKDGGTCSEKLACTLGSVSRTSFKSPESILDTIRLIVPNKYANFTKNFESSLRSSEEQVCKAECSRCIRF